MAPKKDASDKKWSKADKAQYGGCCGYLQAAVMGFIRLWSTALGCSGVGSILPPAMVSIVLIIPISIGCSHWVFYGQLRWDESLHLFIIPALGFLLVFRLQIAYQRFWEARTHADKAIHSCRQIAVLVITQFHRHYGEPGVEVPKCVDDIRRYLMCYYLTLSYQLLGMNIRHALIEDFVTAQEMQLLVKQQNSHAVTCVKWVGARLAHLESLGYMAPLQLHETNEGLSGMIEAFNGLVKIKTTPAPFAIKQLCSILGMIYVYIAPVALADSFNSTFDEYWSVMLRTIIASVMVAVAILGINESATQLEEPWRNSEADLPLIKMGWQLNKDLLAIFADPIPPLVGAELYETESGNKPGVGSQRADVRANRVKQIG